MMQMTDLDVWNAAMDLAQDTFRLSRSFPEHEASGLAGMIRSASTDIPANISAAASRRQSSDALPHLSDARYQLYRLETLFYLAQQLNYISETELSEVLEKLDTTRKLLFGFIKHYKRNIQQQQQHQHPM